MRLTHLFGGAILAALLLALLVPCCAQAQGWGFVEGRVTQAASGEALPGATVLVAGTNFGTAADVDGRYELRIPAGRYALRFSAVGFAARFDSVTVRRGETTRLDAALRETVTEMDAVTVEENAARPVEAGVFELDPAAARKMPTPLKDGFRALKALPGVATNNELSSQYSVRGGGYNENLIFIDGFEVYMPFRPRQGEQEGLGLLNTDLTDRITFYTGGFPARYGGKLSSALNVEYLRPGAGDPLSGTVSASLLDATLSASDAAAGGRIGWAVGLRRATAGRFFGTQELQGDYRPDFTDAQATFTARLGGGHTVEALGIAAKNEFILQPDNKRTYYGSLSPGFGSNLKSLYTEYEGEQRDGYATRFGGVRLKSRLTPRLRMEHAAAYFGTEETESFTISGQSVLTEVVDPAGQEEVPVGYGRQEDTADNRIRVATVSGQGRYRFLLARHDLEAGWLARRLRFDDRLDERAVHVRREGGRDVTTVVEDLEDRATFDAGQAGFYVQDAFDALPTSGRLLVTAGLRTDYFSFNEEWTVSPRLSARYELTDQTTLTGAWGLYYQKPTYREFRGRSEPGETTLEAINRNLQSQRSMQLTLGGERFFPERRLYLRAEAYYKDLANLVSYDIENVRVRYSGENDARGFAYGLDVQLRGELVPGLESWFNYSYLVARERFLPAFQTEYNQGLVPRPADQHHTLSFFVQDYIPGDRTWKLHLRGLYGTGFPFTSPVADNSFSDGIVMQKPGPRNAFRLPNYQRLDAGATKSIEVFEDVFDKPITLRLTAEVLNLFDMKNTVAYTWDGQFNRIPTRLTPRTVNARVQVSF